jgi:NTE family protein
LTDFTNYVFEGGGIKGVGYIGALKALNDTNELKNLKRCIGTSVGSVFALMAVTKCTNEEIDRYTSEFFSKITKFHESILEEAENITGKLGLHSNENIYNAMNDMLKEKYDIENMTFKQLYEKTDVDLTIVGTCLSTRNVTFFNKDNYTDMEVAKAIQISTSIPLFYTITKWKDLVWADGGIVENFAIDHYDEPDGKYNNKTLGFALNHHTTDKVYEINHLYELVEAIEETQLSNNIRQSVEKIKTRNIITIDTFGISSLDYNISPELYKKLVDSGYKVTSDYINNIIETKLKEKEIEDKKNAAHISESVRYDSDDEDENDGKFQNGLMGSVKSVMNDYVLYYLTWKK